MAETTCGAALRDAMSVIIRDAISAAAATATAAIVVPTPAQVKEFEGAIFRRATSQVCADRGLRSAYAHIVQAAKVSLRSQVGPFPDDVLALMFLRGALTADELVSRVMNPEPEPGPRVIVRRMFVRTLLTAAATVAATDTATPRPTNSAILEMAREIEVSCYNAAVRASKEAEDPPRRQWDSPAFVDIYGSRCGTINCLLDPFSAPSAAYGATLAPRLFSAEVTPAALGMMTSKELCPAATAAERAEIANRTAQKVEMKESTLFRCPHCGARRCEYQEVQRRSLDEAPDYLCRCLAEGCKRRFKGRS